MHVKLITWGDNAHYAEWHIDLEHVCCIIELQKPKNSATQSNRFLWKSKTLHTICCISDESNVLNRCPWWNRKCLSTLGLLRIDKTSGSATTADMKSFKIKQHSNQRGKSSHGYPIQFGYSLWSPLQRRNKREILGNILYWPLAEYHDLPLITITYMYFSSLTNAKTVLVNWNGNGQNIKKCHCTEVWPL